MLDMNKRNARFLARMGARGVLGQAIKDYADDGHDFFAVSADLAHASGFDRIIREYPEKFVDVGIAEQNLLGVAAGLSASHVPVIATTWAMFASVRVADQVRNFMGYMKHNIKLVGMDSGFTQSRFSYSHSNPPDIAIMRAIPNIIILSPCDGVEIYKALECALAYEGPVYIRLTGGTFLPQIHEDLNFKYKIGKAITLRMGTDVAIISCGAMVKNSLEAAEILESQGISASVVDMHTIVPLDEQLLDMLQQYKLVVTVEDHLLHGGIGSAVAEYYARADKHVRQIMLGVDDFYPKPGRVTYTEEVCGLCPDQIAKQILNRLR